MLTSNNPSNERIAEAAARVCAPRAEGLEPQSIERVINAIIAKPDLWDALLVQNFQNGWSAHSRTLDVAHAARLSPADDVKQPLDVQIEGSPMTAERFAVCFDPALPTLGVLPPFTYEALPILAAAAQRFRGVTGINIVFLPGLDSEGFSLHRAEDGTTRLASSRGALVAADGSWCAGTFPHPVMADVVTRFAADADERVTKRCADLGLTLLNGLDVLAISNCKARTNAVLAEIGIRSPAQIFLHHDPRVPNAGDPLEGLDRFMEQHGSGGLVCKPIDKSGGYDVALFGAADADEAAEYALRLVMRHRRCVVEQRIESYPLYSPEGDRLDWNLRVLAHGDQIVDMEARVHTWGKPVNKCLGAEIREVESVFRELGGDSAPSLAELQEGIRADLRMLSARFPGGFFGYDIIITPNGERYYIEVNSGAVGGIKSLFDLRLAEGREFAAAARLLEMWSADFAGAKPAAGEGEPLVPESLKTPSKRYGLVCDYLAAGSVERTLAEHGIADAVAWIRGAEDLVLSLDSNDRESDRGLPDMIGRLCQLYNECGSPNDTIRLAGYADLLFDAHPLHVWSAEAYHTLRDLPRALDDYKRALSVNAPVRLSWLMSAADAAIQLADFAFAREVLMLVEARGAKMIADRVLELIEVLEPKPIGGSPKI